MSADTPCPQDEAICGISFSTNHVMTNRRTHVTMETMIGASGLSADAALIAALKK
jgi:hypothetical protein